MGIYGKYSKNIVYNGSEINRKIFLDFEENDYLLSENQFVKKYFQKFNKLHFFTKVEDYKDEKEYRFVVVNKKKEQDIFISIEKALIGVVLGDRFDKVYFPVLRELLKGYNCYSLKWFLGLFLIKKDF